MHDLSRSISRSAPAPFELSELACKVEAPESRMNEYLASYTTASKESITEKVWH